MSNAKVHFHSIAESLIRRSHSLIYSYSYWQANREGGREDKQWVYWMQWLKCNKPLPHHHHCSCSNVQGLLCSSSHHAYATLSSWPVGRSKSAERFVRLTNLITARVGGDLGYGLWTPWALCCLSRHWYGPDTWRERSAGPCRAAPLSFRTDEVTSFDASISTIKNCSHENQLKTRWHTGPGQGYHTGRNVLKWVAWFFVPKIYVPYIRILKKLTPKCNGFLISHFIKSDYLAFNPFSSNNFRTF